jgi:hypothetical protein
VEAVDYREEGYTSVRESIELSKTKDKTTCDGYYWYAEGKYYFFYGLPDNENCIPAWKIN